LGNIRAVNTPEKSTQSERKPLLEAVTSTPAADEAKAPPGSSESRWWQAAIVILIVAAGLRFAALELKPMHHDEGVNGNFMTQLVRAGYYRYDPENYHGPSLYYLTLISVRLNGWLHGRFSQPDAGLSTIALRVVPAVFGLGIVWLILQLRRYLGDYGTLGAAALVAVSPGAVFFSRYFIHEILFLFFTLGIVVAALRFHETARPIYLVLASISAALLVATKETSIISMAVLVLAYLCAAIYPALRRWLQREDIKASAQVSRARAQRATSDQSIFPKEPVLDMVRRLGGWRETAVVLLIALAWFVAIHVALYSSFFTNFPKGIYDSVRTYSYWLETGEKQEHNIYSYVRGLWEQELPTLLAGAAGIALALYRKANRFVLFAAFWAMGILAAYLLIPYRTPWLTLNISVPLAIIGGYAIQEIYDSVRTGTRLRVRVVFTGMAAVLVCVSVYETVSLSFFRYDDDSIPYVYEHTSRQIFLLLDQVNLAVARGGLGAQTGIMISSPEHWPLPWYLRDFPNVGYVGRVAVPTGEAMVIGEETQEPELQQVLGGRYERVGAYELRPGATLVLYVRKDLK
jgi:uncharacterized protein (TIGR03663 family)